MNYFLVGGSTRSELLENNDVQKYPNQVCHQEERLFVVLGRPDWNNTMRTDEGVG